MDPRLQRRVQRYGWDRAAPHYERFWRAQLEPAQRRMLELAALRPGERVLDVACGTGLVTFPAAVAVGPGGRVLATDLSDEMVAAVRAEAERRDLAQVSSERMDAEALDVPDDAFDAALCGLGLMYCPDPGKALSEMRRALRPEGRAVIAVWGARRNCGWAEVFPIVDARVSTEVCPLFFQLGTGETLSESMRSVGLERVETERIAVRLPYGNAKEAIGAAFAGGPVALAYARFDDATRDEAHAAYLASIEPYRRGEGYDIPGEFVVARGWKR